MPFNMETVLSYSAAIAYLGGLGHNRDAARDILGLSRLDGRQLVTDWIGARLAGRVGYRIVSVTYRSDRRYVIAYNN